MKQTGTAERKTVLWKYTSIQKKRMKKKIEMEKKKVLRSGEKERKEIKLETDPKNSDTATESKSRVLNKKHKIIKNLQFWIII